MQANYSAQNGKVSINVESANDYTIASVSGTEVYQLTNKEDGKVSLAAFESPVAAKRFFAANSGYFFTKIF